MDVLAWLWLLTVNQMVGTSSIWYFGLATRSWIQRSVYILDFLLFVYKLVLTHVQKGRTEDNFVALACLGQALTFMHLPVTYMH